MVCICMLVGSIYAHNGAKEGDLLYTSPYMTCCRNGNNGALSMLKGTRGFCTIARRGTIQAVIR
jgi:hypothetical protein